MEKRAALGWPHEYLADIVALAVETAQHLEIADHQKEGGKTGPS